MDFLELSLRMADGNGNGYLPYTFMDAYPDDESAQVIEALRPHVPPRVDAMFSNWGFFRSEYAPGAVQYMCRRATWEQVKVFGSLAEMIAFIEEYYDR